MHSAGPRTLVADRSVYAYALWPLAGGCHTIEILNLNALRLVYHSVRHSVVILLDEPKAQDCQKQPLGSHRRRSNVQSTA